MSTNRDDQEQWLRQSNIHCGYDGDVIEFTDGVVLLKMVRPHLINGTLEFRDLLTDDSDDFLYAPIFFHSLNWDRVEEELRNYIGERLPVLYERAILDCDICKSGIAEDETMGLGTFGELHRSQRNPNLQSYGANFESMDRSPSIVCVACMVEINQQVVELWPDGICHENECRAGTEERCWRQGCPGGCEEA